MINMEGEWLKTVCAILYRYVPDCEVRLFGSRGTKDAKKYSDLDLAIVGKQKLPDEVLFALKEEFQESNLPFRVDVLDWHAISKNFQSVIEKKYEVLQKPNKGLSDSRQ